MRLTRPRPGLPTGVEDDQLRGDVGVDVVAAE
jgi:hypothetical protein